MSDLTPTSDQHTRKPYPDGRSPDYCEECSGAAQEWVAWPCDRDRLVTAVRANESLHQSYEKVKEAGWATPDDVSAAREEGRAEVRAQVAALRAEYLPMVDQGSGHYLNPRIVTGRLAAIAANPAPPEPTVAEPAAASELEPEESSHE